MVLEGTSILVACPDSSRLQHITCITCYVPLLATRVIGRRKTRKREGKGTSVRAQRPCAPLVSLTVRSAHCSPDGEACKVVSRVVAQNSTGGARLVGASPGSKQAISPRKVVC